MINKLKTLLQQTFTPQGAACLLCVVTVVVIIKLAFFNHAKVLTVWQNEYTSRDSLIILRYQIQQLTQHDSTLQYKYNESTTHIQSLPDDSIKLIIANYRATYPSTATGN